MPEHFRDIDHYLASFPPDVQAVLQQIRQEIHRAVPGSAEVISYNIPTMTRGGQRYVHFAGWKAHVSLYPTPDAVRTSPESSSRTRQARARSSSR